MRVVCVQDKRPARGPGSVIPPYCVLCACRTSAQHVALDVAVLHHYRSWENPEDQRKAVRDTDIYRFKDALLQALQDRWTALPDVPLDIPIATYGRV